MATHTAADADNAADVKPDVQNTKPTKPKVDPKDPLRPRRKKARRACHACQRAHLTCGDERPCQRCIKRGLQANCQDGQRKKAKYLHDAPENVLVGSIPNYQNTTNGHAHGIGNAENFGNGFAPKMGFNAFGTSPVGLMGPPTQDGAYASPSDLSMNPMGPSLSFQAPGSNAGISFIDSTDPSLYTLDLSGFQNQYGAFEFNELGQMSLGAAETPPADQNPVQPGFTTSNAGSSGYSPSPNSGANFMFGGESMDWRAGNSQATPTSTMFPSNGLNGANPATYTIAAGPPSFASPSPPASSPKVNNHFDGRSSKGPIKSRAASAAQVARGLTRTATPNLQGPAVIPKRQTSPSSIYKSVQKPHSYTNGFHAQTQFIRKRFPPSTVVRIAKAMASVRPSFISATKALGFEDLVFMEKCFQRTLYEYEDFINACGTPTIVCRRTGEIAAVGKEFSILTGWKKDVLLGREANMNANVGGSSGYASVNSDDSGTSGQKRAVLLAELLDDESVVDFYEDFAKLAFGDARGRIVKRCRLLKYRTEEDMKKDAEDRTNGNTSLNGKTETNGTSDRTRDEKKRSEAAVDARTGKDSAPQTAPSSPEAERRPLKAMPSEDGKVDCSYCWTIKRDVFDIPMLIVMNFLPCLS